MVGRNVGFGELIYYIAWNIANGLPHESMFRRKMDWGV